MTRNELIAVYSIKRDCSKREAKQAVDMLLEIVMNELADGRKVTLSSFGTFAIHERKEKNCHNPCTGEKMKISSRKVPFFKASGNFKEMVNQKYK